MVNSIHFLSGYILCSGHCLFWVLSFFPLTLSIQEKAFHQIPVLGFVLWYALVFFLLYESSV